MRIEGDIPIECIKRCYVVNAVLYAKCPICGEELDRDLSTGYLSYPKVGKTTDVSFCCNECMNNDRDCEFIVSVKVVSAKIVLEYDPETIKSFYKGDKA